MNGNPHHTVRKALSKRHACYILITCDNPTDDGEMQVEMSYEGEPGLASYLLEGAQNYLDLDGVESNSASLS